MNKISISFIINLFFLIGCVSNIEKDSKSSDFKLNTGNNLVISNKQIQNSILEYLEIVESANDSNKIVQIFVEGDFKQSNYILHTVRKLSDYNKKYPTGIIHVKGIEILVYTSLNQLFDTDSMIVKEANKLAKRKLINDLEKQDNGIHDYPTWKITFTNNSTNMIISKEIRSPYAPIIIDTATFIPPKLDSDE